MLPSANDIRWPTVICGESKEHLLTVDINESGRDSPNRLVLYLLYQLTLPPRTRNTFLNTADE